MKRTFIARMLALGEDLPGIWRAATTTAADRKRILRFIIREVALDQKRARGQVAIWILWQTGAVTRAILAARNLREALNRFAPEQLIMPIWRLLDKARDLARELPPRFAEIIESARKPAEQIRRVIERGLSYDR